jgi:AcrR family transcriptional regulator
LCEEHVIDRVKALFSTRGYAATSMSDLTAEVGVHRGSPSCAFGNKRPLFLRQLDRYRQAQARPLAPALLAGEPVLPPIRAVLDGFLQGLRAAAREVRGRPRSTLTMLVQGLQVAAKADPDPRRLVRGVAAVLLSPGRV